jgi:purine-binding chemotaxis protein CheW
MRPLAVEPLPGLPWFVLGVAIIRGRATPVIDALRLANLASTRAATRFVTLKLGARSAALAVTEVFGVHRLSLDEHTALASLLSRADRDAVQAVTLLDRQLCLVLETARLVPEAAWQAVALRESCA